MKKKLLFKFNMNTLKLILGLLIIFMNPINMAAQSEPEWHSLTKQDGIEIFYAIEDCSSTEKLCLKVNNGNNINVVTNFVLVTTNGDTELEHPLLISIEANKVFIINCENPSKTPSYVDVTIDSTLPFSCTLKDLNISNTN